MCVGGDFGQVISITIHIFISRPFVRSFVSHAFISETALTIFLKFGMMLGPSKGSNHMEPFFKKKYTITPKLFILLHKTRFLRFFGLYGKSALTILVKFCQNV